MPPNPDGIDHRAELQQATAWLHSLTIQPEPDFAALHAWATLATAWISMWEADTIAKSIRVDNVVPLGDR